MNYSIMFRRGSRCEHDPNRECTACFKGEMREVFSVLCGEDFDEAWRRSVRRGADDVAEAFEYFALDPREVPACFATE